jgi:hypothetical protein
MSRPLKWRHARYMRIKPIRAIAASVTFRQSV